MPCSANSWTILRLASIATLTPQHGCHGMTCLDHRPFSGATPFSEPPTNYTPRSRIVRGVFGFPRWIRILILMNDEQRTRVLELNQSLVNAKRRSQTATRAFKKSIPHLSEEEKLLFGEFVNGLRTVHRAIQSELDSLVLSLDQKWIPVAEVGFEHLYEVSNLGYVRNSKGNILSSRRKARNYLDVNLSATDDNGNSVQVMRFVHRLVLFAFQPTGDASMQVNHKDGNPANNELSNLEWCTSKYNREHARNTRQAKLETTPPPRITKSMLPAWPINRVDWPVSREGKQKVKRDMQKMRSQGIRTKAIAEIYGCNPRTVRKIVSGEIWGDI
jgi:hypothetical protein